MVLLQLLHLILVLSSCIGGGRGNNTDARTPSPGGSGGGVEGNPGTTQIGGVGIQTRTTNTNAFLPQTSRWSGHGSTGGKGAIGAMVLVAVVLGY